MNEVKRGFIGQGNYHLLDKFHHLLSDPEEFELAFTCTCPQDIVKNIKEGNGASNDSPRGSEKDDAQDTQTPSNTSILSQNERAQQILKSNKISFDPKLHVFNVLGTANKPYVVRLYPHEYCSCPSSGQCYHLIAVKMSIGEPLTEKRQM